MYICATSLMRLFISYVATLVSTDRAHCEKPFSDFIIFSLIFLDSTFFCRRIHLRFELSFFEVKTYLQFLDHYTFLYILFCCQRCVILILSVFEG